MFIIISCPCSFPQYSISDLRIIVDTSTRGIMYSWLVNVLKFQTLIIPSLLAVATILPFIAADFIFSPCLSEAIAFPLSKLHTTPFPLIDTETTNLLSKSTHMCMCLVMFKLVKEISLITPLSS
eukprot:NODE_339_length_10647_cov_0.388320.p8 type:complete len:124 gc:universal NODE_339_length_10647_cov_0.388320:4367-4738(+)